MTISDRHLMHIVPIAEVSVDGLRVYRPAWRTQAVVAGALTVIIGALVLFAARQASLGHGRFATLFVGWVVLWLGLLALLMANDARKARRAAAWLAAVDRDGVYVKLRSYMNTRPDDGLAVWLPFRAIRSAGLVEREWVARDARNHVASRRVPSVEIGIDSPDAVSRLRQALMMERSSAATSGERRRRGVWQHFPVSVEPPRTVRIEWRARPAAQDFLSYLGPFVRIEEPDAAVTDLAHDPDDHVLREAARRGDLMALITAIRVRDGASLEEARERARRMIAES